MADLRKANFKKTFKNEKLSQVLRKKAEEIRHQKRGAAFESKRRTADNLSDIDINVAGDNSTDESFLYVQSNIKDTSNINNQLIGVTALRKLLYNSSNPPVNECRESGLLDYFIQYLQPRSGVDGTLDYALKCETVWCIACLSSGTHDQTSTSLSHSV